MTLHLTINLWWLVYYLATGVALFFPCAVALAWCMPGTVRKNMSGTTLHWWLTRPPVCAAIWPFFLYLTYDEVKETVRVRRRVAELKAKREAS